jgi:hypothetical protein
LRKKNLERRTRRRANRGPATPVRVSSKKHPSERQNPDPSTRTEKPRARRSRQRRGVVFFCFRGEEKGGAGGGGCGGRERSLTSGEISGWRRAGAGRVVGGRREAGTLSLLRPVPPRRHARFYTSTTGPGRPVCPLAAFPLSPARHLPTFLASPARGATKDRRALRRHQPRPHSSVLVWKLANGRGSVMARGFITCRPPANRWIFASS